MTITYKQFRMARAALNLTTRGIGKELGISATAVSRFENGDEGVISLATARKAEEWFRERYVFFGPKHGVCLDQDVFAQERWFASGCFQLLQEAGITPSSADLIEANQRHKLSV
jgi:transcriptional regulator with XRE-family HTH domain